MFRAVGRIVDQLHIAIAQEFSSRYCPHSVALFLTRFWALFALFAVAALVGFARARARNSNGSRLYTLIAGGVLLFAIGSGALVLWGLSGCSGPAAEGLTWDWP